MNKIKALDISTVETLKGLMKDRFNFLIETFLTNTEIQLQNLQTAINNNNAEEIIAIIHGIKGSSGSVGATSIHQLCKNYEEMARTDNFNDNENWTQSLTTEFDHYKVEIQSHL